MICGCRPSVVPLKPYLMKSYTRQNATDDQVTFNRKLSGVRSFSTMAGSMYREDLEQQGSPQSSSQRPSLPTRLQQVNSDQLQFPHPKDNSSTFLLGKQIMSANLLQILIRAGIESNPGPRTWLCSVCNQPILRNTTSV